MPYPTEHAARIKDPGDFQEGSFRSKKIDTGIRLIVGRLKGETTATAQAYRFHIDHFTASEAKKWLKDHDIEYISFEPATEEKMEIKERRTFPVEIRISRDDDVPKIIGHAAIFNEIGDGFWFREKINPGAFKKSIKADDIRALFNHDPNIILGRNKAKTLVLKEDDKGLAIEIVPPDTQSARDLMVSMERGDISQMSFAFQTVKEDWERVEDETDIRTLKEVKLYDVSPVTFPFYEGTDVAVRSHEDWKETLKPANPYKVKLLKRRLNLRRLK